MSPRLDRPGPLGGLRVLDFSRVLAGPFCTMSMADMEKSMMASMPADANMAQTTTLTAGDIAGEPAECTALRASLRQFYTALAYEGLMMAEATPSP